MIKQRIDLDALAALLGEGPAASLEWYVPEYDSARTPMHRYGQIELTPEWKVQVTPDCKVDVRICEQIVAAINAVPAMIEEIRHLRQTAANPPLDSTHVLV